MLGLLVQAMVTGGLPLGVADSHRLRSRSSTVFGPLPPVTLKRPLFPERLQVMITRMTAFAPADRYASLSEVPAEPDLQDDHSLVLARDSDRRCTRAEDFEVRFLADFYDLLRTHVPVTRVHLVRIDRPERWERQSRMLEQAVLMPFAFSQRKEDRTEPKLLCTELLWGG